MMISFLVAMLSLLMYIAIGFFMAIGFQLGEKCIPKIEEFFGNIIEKLRSIFKRPVKTA